MTLWTPSGEHPVDRGGGKDEPTATRQPRPGEAGREPSLEDLSPEQRAQVEAMAQQMQEAQARMLKAPAGSVVGQYVLQLYDVAALYLSQDPPRLGDAHIAIDAFKAAVEAVGSRLGEAEQPLRQALHQIQLAFVELSGRATGAGADAPGDQGADT